MTQTKTEITEARRKKIEELIRTARRIANVSRSHGIESSARLLDDLADVAEEYLKGLR